MRPIIYRVLRILMRGVVMTLWTAAGFLCGFLAVWKYCEWWLVPMWVRQYPHDGQIGLGIFVYALNGGLLAAAFALGFAILWFSRIWPQQKAARQNQG